MAGPQLILSRKLLGVLAGPMSHVRACVDDYLYAPYGVTEAGVLIKFPRATLVVAHRLTSIALKYTRYLTCSSIQAYALPMRSAARTYEGIRKLTRSKNQTKDPHILSSCYTYGIYWSGYTGVEQRKAWSVPAGCCCAPGTKAHAVVVRSMYLMVEIGVAHKSFT